MFRYCTESDCCDFDSPSTRKSANRYSQQCCVQGCKTKVKRNSSTSAKLYRFPRDEILIQEWKSKLQIQHFNEAYRVCGNHFTNADFNLTNLGWRILSPSAVPSRNIPFQHHEMILSHGTQESQILSSVVKKEPVGPADEDMISEVCPTIEDIDIKEEPVEPADEDIISEVSPTIEEIDIKEELVEPADEDAISEVSPTIDEIDIKKEPVEPADDAISEVSSTREEIYIKKEPVEPADEDVISEVSPRDEIFIKVEPVEPSNKDVITEENSDREGIVINSELSVENIPEIVHGVDVASENNVNSTHEASQGVVPGVISTVTLLDQEITSNTSRKQEPVPIEPQADEEESTMNPAKKLKYYEHLDAYDELGMGLFGFSGPGGQLDILNCTECGREFNTYQSLLLHVLKHGGPEPWICHICLSSFANKRELDVHIHGHTHRKPYTCGECKNSFACKTKLQVHSKIHISENPSICDLCGVKFALLSTLNVHITKHKQNFKCKFCPSCFPSPLLLQKHMTCHKPNSKTYHCPLCNDAFTYEDLMKHIKHRHSSKYKCPNCNEEFMTQKCLRIHLRIFHVAVGFHAENRFACTKCKSKFRSQALLQKHSAIHAKLEKIKLDHCGNSGAVSYDDVVVTYELESQCTKKSEDGDEFRCIECGEQCGSSSGLNVHYEKHVKEEEGALLMED